MGTTRDPPFLLLMEVRADMRILRLINDIAVLRATRFLLAAGESGLGPGEVDSAGLAALIPASPLTDGAPRLRFLFMGRGFLKGLCSSIISLLVEVVVFSSKDLGEAEGTKQLRPS